MEQKSSIMLSNMNMMLLHVSMLINYLHASPQQCSYYTARNSTILPSQYVSYEIPISNHTIDISLDIKLHNYCQTFKCNILSLGDSNISYPSLSLNGIENCFEILIITDHIDTEFKIPNADQLLPVDNEFHRINISIRQTQIIFTIDSIPYYHLLNNNTNSTYFISFTELDPFSATFIASNPWTVSVNASMSNICIKLPYGQDEEELEHISCFGSASGTLSSPSDIATLIFYISNDFAVTFNACNSLFDTKLYLADFDFNVLSYNDDGWNCPLFQSEITIPYLEAGVYLLIIAGHDYGQWRLNISCEPIESNLPDTSSYILWIPSTSISWSDAADECSARYGTSLATVITKNDASVVLQLFNTHFNAIAAQDVKIWIGLYRYSANGSEWQWGTGTSCEYTVSGNCIDDEYWRHNQQYHSYGYPLGTYVMFSEDNIGFLAARLGSSVSDRATAFLCNAPNPKGRYLEVNCMNRRNCWHRIGEIYEYNVLTDYIDDDIWTLRAIFWESEICIIGYLYIHCTTGFTISNTDYQWTSFPLYKTGDDIFHPTEFYYR
eukprot:477169_1